MALPLSWPPTMLPSSISIRQRHIHLEKGKIISDSKDKEKHKDKKKNENCLKNIRRSPFQALAAIFVITITLFIIGIFSLVTLASQEILLNFETKPQVIAYLKDEHTPVLVNNLIHLLQSTEGIKSAQYISKQDALELYKKVLAMTPSFSDQSRLGHSYRDILPASIEITASNPSSFPTLLAFWKIRSH